MRDHRRHIAGHFHDLTQITRADIFGDKEEEVRPINLLKDTGTMFSGFVGKDYQPNCGFLVLAINPGGGGDAYNKRIPEDEIFYPLLHALKAAPAESADDAFEAVNTAFVPIVKAWNLWRILGPTLDAAGTNLDAIAYMNVVPYRTRNDKMPPAAARKIAWELIIDPSISLLRPHAIIALGKKAGSVVENLLPCDIRYYCVPRTIGDSWISDDAKKVHELMREELIDE
jgi:hypothetical protein